MTVRKGEVEKLFEAGSHAVSIRVIRDKRTAVCNTSDLTPRALDEMVRTAVELAKISEPDEYAGLPAKEDLATDMGGVAAAVRRAHRVAGVDEMKDIVLRAEQAAFDFDTRDHQLAKAQSSAPSAASSCWRTASASAGITRTRRASFSVSVMADDADGKKRTTTGSARSACCTGWSRRRTSAARAAARAVRKLGGRKVDDARVPVVWEPTMTARAAGHRARRGERRVAVQAIDVPRRTSRGRQVASPLVTIMDDPTLPGSSARARSTAKACARGATRSSRAACSGSSCSTATTRAARGAARRAARRAWATRIGIGGGEPDHGCRASDAAEIIASVDDGLYLTELMGFGINQTTGDFSRGATGVWIERGELAYPVVEINVSGNLKQMLRDIDAVGSDLQWRAGGAAPTVRMSKMTVSGL